jgi:hypothetical protein
MGAVSDEKTQAVTGAEILKAETFLNTDKLKG